MTNPNPPEERGRLNIRLNPRTRVVIETPTGNIVLSLERLSSGASEWQMAIEAPRSFVIHRERN